MKPQRLAWLLGGVLAVLVLSMQVGPLWLVNATAPFHAGIAGLARNMAGFNAWLEDVHKLRQERDNLASERNQLLAQVAQLQSQVNQNQAWARQTTASAIPASRLIAARTAGLVNRGQAQYLLINKGKDDELSVGQVALADGVLIGRIKEMDQHVSLLQLPQSQGSVIPIVIRYSEGQTKGVVEGSFNLTAQLTQVLPSERLETGATLVTSGDGATYPPDLVVGKVGDISHDDQTFQSASVVLPWDLSNLTTVFLLKP